MVRRVAFAVRRVLVTATDGLLDRRIIAELQELG